VGSRSRGFLVVRATAACLLLAPAGCGRDAADRHYSAALEGADRGAPLEEQLRHVERAIATKPRAPYYQLRAGYRWSLGDLPGAELDYDVAIGLADQPYLRFERANLIASRGEPARALPDYDLAIAGQPGNVQYYRGRALARAALGRGAEALADAEHVLARLPQQAESWHARGVARLALGRAREAVADFDHALRERPELAYVWSARADAHERLGDLQHAASDRARAVQVAEQQAGCGVCRRPYH
jgi:tetratricopeptide (TPR) repeat protein